MFVSVSETLVVNVSETLVVSVSKTLEGPYGRKGFWFAILKDVRREDLADE